LQQSTDSGHQSGDEPVDEPVDEYVSDFEVGQDNVQPFGLDFHQPVFAISAIAVIVFVAFTLAFPQLAANWFGDLRPWLTTKFDFFFMAAGNIFVLFCIALIVLPVGKVRIGGPDAEPMYSYASWVSMLFAAGIGIGIMFYAVLEPMNHLLTPPLGMENLSEEAQRELAMAATVFHWAIHPWAIYGIVGLALAFFAYNKGLPLTMRSVFYPVLGERIWGWPGHAIDILAVFATLFGLATSLGLGATQAAAGLNYLFGIPNTNVTMVVLIISISLIALVSVVLGVDKGVQRLSQLNMVLAFLLVVFVMAVGPTLLIVTGFFENLVAYLVNLPALSMPFGREDANFSQGWTTFYWAWWVSWAPFVSMFIARVSRGRTVREFLIAVLLVPSTITVLWVSTLGGTAVDQVITDNFQGAMDSALELQMFVVFSQLPLSQITSLIGIVLVVVFFITSSDSGSLVIDSITAGGKVDAPKPQRIFWALIQGAIAIALLLGGGLKALAAAVIVTALPFTFVLLVACYGMVNGLISEPRGPKG